MDFLRALFVFQNTINQELIRSLHVYQLKDGNAKEVEREFLFYLDRSYVEIPANPIFKIQNLGVLGVFQGQVLGLWRCIFAFHSGDTPPLQTHIIPSLLSISSNPKLMSIPNLSYDLQVIFKLSSTTLEAESAAAAAEEEEEEEQISFGEKGEIEKKDFNQSKRSVNVLDQDLNCLPSNNQSKEFNSLPDNAKKKNKRAATGDIARIALEDLVKYFDLPIAEASRNLKVGLTVLKRKCRELGIPRWPHRKIKSLDNLIRNLQEEAEWQKQENEEAAKAVAKRQKMLEREKESIERKPFMEIQSETKRFRQDVFKRRHRAKAFRNQAS